MLAPPRLIGMIGIARLDPAPAGGGALALPEPGVALQMVHREVGGEERVAAMARRGGDEDDGLAGLERAGAVEDQEAVERPALHRLGGELLHPGQSQPRIGAELELEHRVLAALRSDLAEKAGDAAGLLVGVSEA